MFDVVEVKYFVYIIYSELFEKVQFQSNLNDFYWTGTNVSNFEITLIQ